MQNKILVCFISIFLISSAKAEALKPAETPTKIRGLTWSQPLFEYQETRDELKIFAILEGVFNQEDSNLVFSNQRVPLSKGGVFRIKLPVVGPKSIYYIDSVGLLGIVETEKIEINFPLWKEKMEEFRRYKGKTHFFSGSLGLSFLSYRETDQIPFTQKAITAKLAYNHFIFPPNWELGASAYLTTVSLTSDQPGVGMRFLGLNARIGYAVPFVRLPWRLTIMGGVYYTTTFVTGNQFGFDNLMGPQFFPVVKRLIGSRESIGAYFKFSPVGRGISVIALSNREIAAGINLTRTFNRGKSASISVDLASLDLTIDEVRLISNSASFSIGYGW